MKNKRMLFGAILVVVCTLAVLVMTVLAQGDADLRVFGVWVRPGDQMSAAYLRITNAGQEPEQLVAVESAAMMAEIHETRMENDVMRMRPIDSLDIPPGETVALEPGGFHIMLMNVQEPLIEGHQVPLTLVFASGKSITVEASVTHTPIPYELEVDALAEAALTAIQEGTYIGQVVDPPIQVQDFIAPGSQPERDRLSDTNGTWRLIFFGYMHCPDFCPLTLADYTRVKSELGAGAEDVTFVFVSVDSARDTPGAMQRYLDKFDPAFVGFSPDDPTLNRIQPDYGFYYERRLDSGTQAIYTIDHSTRSYLLDRDGVLRASFAYDTAPRAIADSLLWYMSHE